MEKSDKEVFLKLILSPDDGNKVIDANSFIIQHNINSFFKIKEKKIKKSNKGNYFSRKVRKLVIEDRMENASV